MIASHNLLKWSCLTCVFIFSSQLLAFNGPLRVHPQNGRYFTDNNDTAILLTGSHTWATVQDIDYPGRTPFDFTAFLDMGAANGHNFIRLWNWEQPMGAGWSRAAVYFSPLPWARTGPGKAADGNPKFNLDQYNDAYFARLRQRVVEAGERGFYVSVMLFQGWSLKKTGGKGMDPYTYHPFNPANNIQAIGAPHSTEDIDAAETIHSLKNSAVVARQEAYVRQVIDCVNDLDNVLYEIINEGGAVDWQRHMIRYIHEYEKSKGKQHPVGFTHRIAPRMWNDDLFTSEANWISPAKEPQDWLYPGSVSLQDYAQDPPANDGRKVILLDTDHLWGHGGDYIWVWKSVCRGHNPLFMDPWDPIPGEITREEAGWFWDEQGRNKNSRDYPLWPPLRAAMGDVRRYTQRMNLARAVPRNDLVSSQFCLADVGAGYLVFIPGGGSVTLDLRGAAGPFTVEWFNPVERTAIAGDPALLGNDYVVLIPPFTGTAAVFLFKTIK